MGVDESRMGTIPFAVSVAFEGDAPDGPVNMRRLTPEVERALGYAHNEVKEKINEGRRQRVLESVVIRSRQGDQNAMAIIMGIQSQAKAGNKRAIESEKTLKKVIRHNPPKVIAQFGFDASDTPYVSAATIVVKGPSMSPSALYHKLAEGQDLSHFRFAIAKAVETALKPAFFLGYKSGSEQKAPKERDARCMYMLGHVVACARQLQDFRKTEDIKKHFPVSAWELGE